MAGAPMEQQQCTDPPSAAFSEEDAVWAQVHEEEESDDVLHRKCTPCTVHLHNDDGKETSLMDVVGSKDTGILRQKINLEAETADRMNNNQERFPGAMAQKQVPCVDLETEVDQLLDSMEANVSGSDKQPDNAFDQCLETRELSDVEDKWEGSADENRDSFSDRSVSPDDVEDQEVQCLQVQESLDIDDQGICVDDQVSGDVSDDDEQEVNAVNDGGILYTQHQGRQNEMLCFGDESGEHSRLALEEFRLKYEEICSVAAAENPECMNSSCHSSESEIFSAEVRDQDCKLPHNYYSEGYAATALEDTWSDYQNILPRRNKPISRVGADDTLLCVKRNGDSTEKVSLLYNGGVDNANSNLEPHTQQYVVHPEKDSPPFTGTEKLCHTLESAMTHALKELPEDPVALQQKSTNGMPAPECTEINNLENEAVQQDDDTSNDPSLSLAFVQEPDEFGAEELDLIETDKSEVQSQNSQDDAQQASSETEEDLDIDDDQSQSVDMLGEAQPFLAGSIFCPPGSRNYEYRLEDHYDGVDDKVESRDFIGDRGRDISDKLDPEILHLLELHLQKQQLVVIEEEEEEEEESDFDSFHVNAHKLHFESFGPSRKRGKLLDMVLEEPELLEDKEQEEDDLREVKLEDIPILNSDMKEERNPCESGHNGVKYGASGGVHHEDIPITDTIDDTFKGVSDNNIERTLPDGVQEELASENDLQCCSEFSQFCNDMDHDDEPCSVIGDLQDCNHTGQDNDLSEVQALELKIRLFEKIVEDTNASGLGTASLPFRCQQSTTVNESKTCTVVCNAFRHDVDICDGMKTSPGGCKTTELANMMCFDDVTKHCGQTSLILTAEGREQTFENAGWPLEASSEQLVSSTLTTEQKNHSNAVIIPRLLDSMSVESHIKSPFLQQETNGPRASTDLLGTATEEVLEAEVEQTISGHEDGRLPLRHGVPPGFCQDPRNVTYRCTLEDAKATSVEEPLACCEKGPDVYQQLAEALVWAQASERRNSELHDELELLRARYETLCREKAKLETTLMEREAVLQSFQVHREEGILCRGDGAAANAPTRHSNETELVKIGSTHEAPPNEAGDRCAGSKEVYGRSLLQAEFDALRQESRDMVEQLNSLQEDLKAFRHPRKPSNLMRHLFRTSLVAALGMILFWWGTKHLG